VSIVVKLRDKRLKRIVQYTTGSKYSSLFQGS